MRRAPDKHKGTSDGKQAREDIRSPEETCGETGEGNRVAACGGRERCGSVDISDIENDDEGIGCYSTWSITSPSPHSNFSMSRDTLTPCAADSKIISMIAKYTVVLDREIDGRSIASVPGIPGCHTYGRPPLEAVRRVKRALRFFLMEVAKEGKKLPDQPKPITVNISLSV